MNDYFDNADDKVILERFAGPNPRARRFAETFRELGKEHGKPELMTLATEIDETFVQQGREMTTTDENAALDAAAATFRP